MVITRLENLGKRVQTKMIKLCSLLLIQIQAWKKLIKIVPKPLKKYLRLQH